MTLLRTWARSMSNSVKLDETEFDAIRWLSLDQVLVTPEGSLARP